jgi:hypothetical protein
MGLRMAVPGNMRARLAMLAATGFGGILVLAPVFAPAAGTSLPACANTDLVPRVADLQVTQGAPGYARLARGKDTIVRAYLATPNTCTVARTQSITPVSATLDVTNGAALPALSISGLTGNLGSNPLAYSTSDPSFVLPAAYLTPVSTGSFTLTVTLHLIYTRTGAANQTLNVPPKTVAVDRKTNALRILVVPMVDPSSTNVQWSSDAQSSFQNTMTNVDRALPLPTGTGDLSLAATGGIRYVISGGPLDVKSLNLYKTLNGVTKFCANSANWSTSQVTSGGYAGHTLKGDLLQQLADYNRLNNPPADMVLGVIDGKIAFKSSDGVTGGCDDGRAATPTSGQPGQVAWVRITNPTTDTPANYPSPVPMEILHTLGIVRPSVSPTYHSTAVEADGGSTVATDDHGYNLLQQKPISAAAGALGLNDHSLMNYNTTSIPYTKDNTLLEPRDWADALCDFGGVDSATPTPYASCSETQAVGTSLGVGANAGDLKDMFQISGTINGSVVTVTKSQTEKSDAESGIGADSSLLHLLECAGDCGTAANIRKNVPLALLGDEGHTHDTPGGEVDPASTPNGFDAVLQLAPGVDQIALTLGTTTVYSAAATAPAPSVTSVDPQPIQPGTVLGSFATPGANGRGIAFDGTYLYTTNDGTSTTLYKFSTSGSLVASIDTTKRIGSLAYNPTSSMLYAGNYTGNGELYTVDRTSGATTTLPWAFDAGTDGPTCFGKYIDGLEVIPGGNFAIGGDRCRTVFIKNPADGTTVSSFTTGDDRSGITTDGAQGLWVAVHALEGVQTTLEHVDLQGHVDSSIDLGAYFAEDLAYDATTFAPHCAVWANSIDTPPSVEAFEVPCSGRVDTAAVEFQATDAKFGSAYFTCGDPNDINTEKFPIATGLKPEDTSAAVQTFLFYYTLNLSCGTGSPKVIVTAGNGWLETPLTDTGAQITVAPTSKEPVPAIAAPLEGSSYRLTDKIHFAGTGEDAEDGDLTGDSLRWTEGTTSRGMGNSFDVAASTLGAGFHTITLTATDSNGHAVSTSVTIHISADTTPPVLTLSQTPNGTTPWWKGPSTTVTEGVSASDNAPGDSGLASISCAVDFPVVSTVVSNPTTLTITGDGVHVVSCTATDNAGNQTTKNDLVFVDLTPPTLNPTVSPNPVTFGGAATAKANATDATSLVASQSCGSINTSILGQNQTVSCSATDNAGNSATATATYAVQYASSGICIDAPGRLVLQPVNSDGSSVFKKGNSVPVRFRVCDAAGKSIGTAGVVLATSSLAFHPPAASFGCATPPTSSNATPLFCKTLAPVGAVDEAVVSTASDTSFRWDPSTRQWVFNMATSTLTAGRQLQYYIPLNDGTYIFFVFAVK